MISKLLCYAIVFPLSDFFRPASNQAQEEKQLEAVAQALLAADCVPDAMGLKDNKVLTIAYRSSEKASEVRDVLQSMRILKERDGDPWWVKMARGEAIDPPKDGPR